MGSDTSTAAERTSGPGVQKVTLFTLTAMVVGGMVGAGVFSLPRRFASETGVYGALIAWAIAGTGMLMLAFVFQTLAIRKPDLDSGVYAYAKAGFGEYLGFFSAFGYWASACVGNTTYWVLITSTLGALVPVLGDGDTLAAVLVGSVGIWAFAALILGVEGASVYSRYARWREDVGKATVLGFVGVLATFASVTIVSYCILPRAEIAQLRQPSMAGVLEAAIGGWGAVFVSVGLIVSVLGAYLAWT